MSDIMELNTYGIGKKGKEKIFKHHILCNSSKETESI